MTEYYVSINGVDTNNGLFPASPWRHLQYATNHLIAGDILHIMNGTYQEQVVGANSGADGSYITFTNYNGGLPVIDGSWMTSQDDGLVAFRGQHHIRLSGLKVQNASAYGLFFPGSEAYTHDIVIDHCEIQGCSLSGIYMYPPNNMYGGYIDNVLVEDNVIHDCQNWWNWQSGEGPNETVTLSNVNNFILRNNYMYFNHKLTVDIKNNSRNGQVYRNIIDNYATPNNGCEGIYIDAYDDNAMDINVFNNIVYGPFTGYTLGTEQGGTLSRIKLFNNIYQGTGHAFQINNMWHTKASNCMNASCSGDISNCCETPGVNDLKIDCSVINNTVCHASVGFFLTDRTESFPPNNFIIRNNIFSATKCFATGSGNIDWTKLLIDHNLSNATSSDYWGDTIRLDPKFIDAVNNNFHLQPASPCINAGNNSNAPTRDFDYYLRDSQVDIGCYEYGASNSIDDYITFNINVL